MSFNLAAGASVSSASLQALSSLSLQQPAAHPAAAASTASVDDVPPCGTPTPGHPPIPHGLGSLLDKVALNPQPLPPKGGKAAAYDDGEWCGTVPRKLPNFPPPPPGPWADIASVATGMAR